MFIYQDPWKLVKKSQWAVKLLLSLPLITLLRLQAVKPHHMCMGCLGRGQHPGALGCLTHQTISPHFESWLLRRIVECLRSFLLFLSFFILLNHLLTCFISAEQRVALLSSIECSGKPAAIAQFICSPSHSPRCEDLKTLRLLLCTG